MQLRRPDFENRFGNVYCLSNYCEEVVYPFAQRNLAIAKGAGTVEAIGQTLTANDSEPDGWNHEQAYGRGTFFRSLNPAL